MKLPSMLRIITVSMLGSGAAAFAGGSYYNVEPGANPEPQGEISEWSVPTPQFARDPAPGPDGNIYIAVMNGNRIAQFKTEEEAFHEWELPPNARPHGLLVDDNLRVWYTGYGDGSIGELDVATGEVTRHEVAEGGNPHTLIIDDEGIIWFSNRGNDRLGRLDTNTGEMKTYPAPGGPYGLTFDHDGNVWLCLLEGNAMFKLNPETEESTTIDMGASSGPRRVATCPVDGSLWITLYGRNELVRMDPATQEITHTYAMPGDSERGAYAVSTDANGIVWVNDITVDEVARLDPRADEPELEIFALPSSGVGIRKMIVGSEGELWYMGSHNGRLGVLR